MYLKPRHGSEGEMQSVHGQCVTIHRRKHANVLDEGEVGSCDPHAVTDFDGWWLLRCDAGERRHSEDGSEECDGTDEPLPLQESYASYVLGLAAARPILGH